MENKPKSSKLKLILGVLLIVAATFTGAYFLLTNEAVAGKILTKQEKSKELISLSLEDFIINLSDLSYRRYLKINLVVEFEEKSVGEEITQKNYKIRDSVINLLSSKSVEEIKSIEGKEKVKGQLIETINKDLQAGKIQNLYWTEFVVQ